MEDLSKYSFLNELKNFAENCTKLKPNTAKKNATILFNKYSGIMSSSQSNESYYKEKAKTYEKLFETLKSQKICYSRGGETEGVLLIKNIEQIEVNEIEVIIITKNDRKINLSTQFSYLKDLF